MHTKGPWKACHDGDCKCKQVWSETADHPVAHVLSGEWGDKYPSLRFIDGSCEKSIAPKIEAYTEIIAYGEIHEDVARANARLIAAAPELKDVVRDCVNFLADLDNKSDRAKALHKRAYTAHSKATPHADTLKGE